ncbi:hypothetical protein BH09BAC5_BH09BAC5_15690 [soil metagenome]
MLTKVKLPNEDFDRLVEFEKKGFLYSQIIASADFAVKSKTLDGTITSWNQGARKIYGYKIADVVGKNINLLIPPDGRAEFVELLKKVFSGEIIQKYETKRIRKDGVIITVSLFLSPIKDECGKIIGVSTLSRDITKVSDANKELIFQNQEKAKRADELIIANKELAFQNGEKEKRADELIIANKELLFQNEEKEKRANELIIANKELAFQHKEKGKRADELVIANKELVFQNEEKEKRADELIIANKELLFQNEEKEKRANELIIANEELAFQHREKGKRADELVIANKELAFQNEEKEKRAQELIIANKELVFQNEEKGKRADELIIANQELLFQNSEKQKRKIESEELEASTYSANLASKYSRSLIEASRDPLVTISPNGKITDGNEALVQITGVKRELLIGTDFSGYFTEPEKAREGYKQVFEKGFVSNYPLTIRNKNGKLTDVLYNASVYKDERGKVLGVFAAARDITAQNIIAKELTEAKIFAELATELAEEAKIKAESATRIAVEAVKAKQQFLSNMSHEIRTPMNAIIGFTKVVMKTELTVKQAEYLQAIKLSGDALIVLINDILDLAKVDAGKMTFARIPFKMAMSISAMLHLFEPKIEEKNLELIIDYDKNIPEVLVGDSVRLHQIILNLVSNAVKFTSKGSITVRIKMLHEDKEQVKIEFSVIDTGIGIAANKIDKIFENFQQATSDTSRLFGGTGLGLAIVKKLVESQNGKISVVSNIDSGSTFSFVLDFQKTNAKAEFDAELVELDHEIKNIKVLVVEDIALNQLLMKTLLDEFGFDWEIASNGKIAIEKVEKGGFDIILMDLQMPEMNGFEATEYIRKTLHSKIPIVALTADVTTADLAKCTAVGMDDYISKPVDEKVLYGKIIALAKQKKEIVEEVKLKEAIRTRCISMDNLIRLTKPKPALLVEMIDLYLEQTPPLVLAMKQSLKDKDWKSLALTVHKMIPSFSIVGINVSFENMARKVHEYAKAQEQSSEINDMVLEIENVCMQACEELKEEIKNIKKSTNGN